MNFTGERFIPTLDEADIAYEHWHRYLFAGTLAAGKRVLDVASGEGYGAAYLATIAQNVTGVDVDEAAVAHAAKTYRTPNLEFLAGNAARLPFAGERNFDLITSFETIEHLSSDDQEAFVAEIQRLLVPDGIAIISTPDRLHYSDLPRYSNPFHLHEFYKDQFIDFLGSHFQSVEILGQRTFSASSLWPIRHDNSCGAEFQIAHFPEGFRPCPMRPREPRYLIAICSNAKLIHVTGSVMLDLSDRKMVNLSSKLHESRAVSSDLNAQLADRDRSLNAAAGRVAELLALREAELQAVRERDTQIAVLEAQVTELRLANGASARHDRLDAARIHLESAMRAIAESVAGLSDRIGGIPEAIREAAANIEVSKSGGIAPAQPLKTMPLADYAEAVHKCKDAIAASTPPGAVVAVISKGDPALIDLPGRTGRHFPATPSGQYAGYHPADDAEAINALSDAISRGVSHLAVPATSRWWLDHYGAFAARLKTAGKDVSAGPHDCIVFSLSRPSIERSTQVASTAVYPHLVDQLRRFISRLLPAQAKVLMVSHGDPELLRVPGLKVSHFPQDDTGQYRGFHPADDSEAIAHLETLRKQGARWLVFPATSTWWLIHYAGLARHLERRYQLAASRQHVGVIYDLEIEGLR